MARVLLINNRFGHNAVGGAERMVERELQTFRTQGDEVIILATEKFHGVKSFWVHQHSEEHSVYRWYPFNICSYEQLERHWWFLRLIWHVWDLMNIPAALVLRGFVHRFKPDRIVTHNLMGVGMMLRWGLMGGVKKIPWRHVLHDVQLLYPSGIIVWGEERSWKYISVIARWYRAITRWLLTPDTVTSPSQWLFDEHRRWGFFNSSNHVIQSPTSLCISTVRRVDRNDRRMRRLLFVGQVERHKGIVFLVNALKYYNHPFILQVVGSGAIEKILREETRSDDHYQWLGWKSLNDLTVLYQQCDALIVPSLCYENAPTVIVEAREFGTPIIASRIGGIPELIDDPEGLFEPNNTSDFIRALYLVVGPSRS